MNICCPFEGCSGKFSRTRKLSVHMERDHAFHCKRIELTFPHREEFQRWLDDLNGRSNVSFVCWHGRKTSYVLQCSKSRKGKKKPVSEKKHTTKLDIICPAHISVCQRDDGYVMVSAQLSHYGHEVSPSVFDVPVPEGGIVEVPSGAENPTQEEALLEDEEEEEIFAADPDGGDDADDNKLSFGLKDLANIATAMGLNGNLDMDTLRSSIGNDALRETLEAQNPTSLTTSATPDVKKEEEVEKATEPTPSTSALQKETVEAPPPSQEQPEPVSFYTEIHQSIPVIAALLKLFDAIGPDDRYSQEDQEAILDKLEHATACLQDASKKIPRRASVIVSDSSTGDNTTQSSNRRKRRQPVAFDLDP
uniref:C2H2-type domain-containing protein n=1 Tax=Steinernema glaseri TaxID=37863 RepID=A0A1I7YQ80_9BILA